MGDGVCSGSGKGKNEKTKAGLVVAARVFGVRCCSILGGCWLRFGSGLGVGCGGYFNGVLFAKMGKKTTRFS